MRAALEAVSSSAVESSAAVARWRPTVRDRWILAGGAALIAFSIVASLTLDRDRPRLSTGAPASPNAEANEY